MTDIHTAVPRREIVKEKSVTMEYFLETSHLDHATADMLKKYDKDGNGSFSKDEVVSIVLDLREALKSNESLDASNKVFRRLLIAAVVFCVLLLTSMFGLSYAVAALTANTEVQSDGTLMSTGSNPTAIATDSRANLHELYTGEGEAPTCVSFAEVDAIQNEVMGGKNVLIRFNEFEEGSTKMEQLTASGATFNETDGSMCFQVPEGNGRVCLTPSPKCTAQPAEGRRLFLDPSGLKPDEDLQTLSPEDLDEYMNGLNQYINETNGEGISQYQYGVWYDYFFGECTEGCGGSYQVETYQD